MEKKNNNEKNVDVKVNPSSISDRIKGTIAFFDNSITSHRGSDFSNIDDEMNKYINAGKVSAPVKKINTHLKDHYVNSITGAGTNNEISAFSNYGLNNDTLNWPLWLALYNDSWVFKRAIDKPAQDEVTCGFFLRGDKDFSPIYKMYNRYKQDLISLLKWGALFGGSVAVVLFEGISDEELAKPLDVNKIKNRRFKLYVTDRWYGCACDDSEMVNNMADIDYGQPAYYDITFGNGVSTKVHHSYVLRYEHRNAPRLIKTGLLQNWGYAEGSHILNELLRDDQLKNAISSLINKSLIEVVKMSGMRGIYMGTDKENEEQLMARLEMVTWARNYNSLTILDKDDEYQQNTFGGLSGLAELLNNNMWLVSAALEMPGVLFGDMKGGMSQETDAYRRYAQTIYSRCEAYYRPVLNKFLKILFIVNDIDAPVDFDFKSLAIGQDNADKIKGIEDYSRLLTSLMANKILSTKQVAESLKLYMDYGIVTINFDERNIQKLELEEAQGQFDTIKNMSTANQVLNAEGGEGAPQGGGDMGEMPLMGSPDLSPSLEAGTGATNESFTSETPGPESLNITSTPTGGENGGGGEAS